MELFYTLNSVLYKSLLGREGRVGWAEDAGLVGQGWAGTTMLYPLF